MLRPLPFAIATRYLRVRRRSRFVSVVAAVAVAGVALAVASLIVVLSVMNGMQGTISKRLLSVTAEVNVTASEGDALRDPRTLTERVEAVSGVVSSAPFTQRQVVLGHGGALAGARLRGIALQRDRETDMLGKHILAGSVEGLKRVPFGIVLSRRQAVALNVFPGDKVAVIAPHGLVTPVGFVPRMRRFTVVAISGAGSARAGPTPAITNLSAVGRLFGLDGPAGLQIALSEPLRAATVAKQLRSILPDSLLVTTWEAEHRSLFQALSNEQRMVFVLLALAILIAAFNVLGVLGVLVADKRSEIAVLTSLGLTPRRVLLSFLILGGLIGAAGIVLGLVAGLAVAFNVNGIVTALSHLLGHPLFASGTVTLGGLPSKVMAGQVTAVVVLAAVLVLIASWLPAHRAARMRPVEALSGG